MLGQISSAFIRNEEFLRAILDGEEDTARAELTHELRTFFSDYVNKL